MSTTGRLMILAPGFKIDPAGAYADSVPSFNPATGGLFTAYSDFYVVHTAGPLTVAPGALVTVCNVQVPGFVNVTRTSATVATIVTTGTYWIRWQASITEGGTGIQLGLSINGVTVACAGRTGATNQLCGDAVLPLTAGDTVSLINPAGNANTLTLTSLAGNTGGGLQPVSSLSIVRISA